MENYDEAIIKKIKGLLSLSKDGDKDGESDEESQTAFLLAQRLMIKHRISITDVQEEKSSHIKDGQVTAYKRMFWWEVELSSIISENFRVKCFLDIIKVSKQKKRSIKFLGYEQDVNLAKEIYLLAYEAIQFHSNKYITAFYQNGSGRSRRVTFNVKNSYIRGFLNGLQYKFNEQFEQLQQEYGLMVTVPAEVERKFDEIINDAVPFSIKIPSIEEIDAFENGYSTGKKIDYTQSRIDHIMS